MRSTDRMLHRHAVLLLTLFALGACGMPEPRRERELPRVDGGPQPVFGATVRADSPPPPISGGTLAIARMGDVAVAADPDRDVIWVVDLVANGVRAQLQLQAGDEPGRAVESADGTFHVALRRGGAIVTLDARTGTLGARTPVCAAPRGMAFDPVAVLLHVACVSGELISLRIADLTIARSVRLDDDLRDIVLDGDRLLVSRFRSAEVLTVEADGTISDRRRPFAISNGDSGTPSMIDASAPGVTAMSGAVAGVAWRMIAAPGGGALITHQQSEAGRIDDETQNSSAYGRRCGGIVRSGVTFMTATRVSTTIASLLGATLPVDIAASLHSDRIVVVAAGNTRIDALPEVFTLHAGRFPPSGGGDGCSADNEIRGRPPGQPVAAAFTPDDTLIVQAREPAGLYIVDRQIAIPFGAPSREDTGHTIFHSNGGLGLACASCHPEGGDDGRVWNFTAAGRRRTQNLRGGILGTEPFHWGGEFRDTTALVSNVFSRRMGGPVLVDDQLRALEHWMDTIPALPAQAVRDATAVERGRALFTSPDVNCASCHSGPKFTNNAMTMVGTSIGPLQVPRLNGLATRAPYMHDGCAATLTQRFDPACGGGDLHGHTSQLAASQIADLVAYLETL